VALNYVTDVSYVFDLTPELAPGWLDLAAIVGGYAPPRSNGRFGWCELGCGLGLTANISAATHPAAAFVGIDVMPAHIAAARDPCGRRRQRQR